MPSAIRIALRSLWKTPTFTLTALATLGVGIGSTVAMLAVVEAVLLEPLPYPEPERLAVVWTRWTARDLSRVSHTGNDFREYQRRTRLFEGIAAVGSIRQNLTFGSEPSQVQVGWVSGSRPTPSEPRGAGGRRSSTSRRCASSDGSSLA